MPDINAQFPLKGIHEGVAYTGQPPATTREAVNVQGADPVSGRTRGAQRPGLSLYNTSQINGSSKIADIAHVVYDNSKNTWSLSASDITGDEWNASQPGLGDCYDIAIDRQSNVYTTDLNSTIAKHNSAGNLVYKLSVPVVDSNHRVRSLCVDEDDYIYCGVFSGGDQNTCKLFAYEQIDSNTNNRVWDITVPMYAKRMMVDKGFLYVLFDDTLRQRSYVHVYDSIQSGVPLLKTQWEVPYPANDFCISGKDGAIVTTHAPNSSRGTSQTSPGSTASSIDWTPTLLPSWEKRVWCWLDATDIDGDGTNNSDYESGDEILTWYDKSGNNRHLYSNTDAVDVTLGTTDRGPTLVKQSVAGRDAVVFNGVNQSMMSGSAVNKVVGASYGSLRGQNLTLWPSETGAQFALFAVIRAPQEEVVRALFSQEESTSHDYQRGRSLCINKNPSSTSLLTQSTTAEPYYGPAPMLGSICWSEQCGVSTTFAAPFTKPNPTGLATGTGIPSGACETGANLSKVALANTVGFRPRSGSSASDYTLITLIQNGGSFQNGTLPADGGFMSKLFINGIPADAWHSRGDIASLMPVYLGWTKATPATNTEFRFKGLVCEIIVLSDWYEQGATPLESPVRRYPVTSSPYPYLSSVYTGDDWTVPDTGASYWTQSTTNVTAKGPIGLEQQVIEGYLAHKWGMAHLLPQGQANGLSFYRSTNAANNNAVVIDDTFANSTAIKTYTYKTTPAAANDLVIYPTGTSAAVASYKSLMNLYYAINGTGSSANYFAGTSSGRNALALPPVAYQPYNDTSSAPGEPQYYMRVVTRSVLRSEIGYAAGFSTSVTNALWDTTSTWSSSVNAGVNTATTYRPKSAFQHPFYLYTPFGTAYFVGFLSVGTGFTVISTLGGPPRSDAKRFRTPYESFSNPYGSILKWDSGTGKLKWGLFSRYGGKHQNSYGGIGYGVSSNKNGVLCCIGPAQPLTRLSAPQTTTSTPQEIQGGVSADSVTIRALVDTGNTVTTTGGWSKTPNTLTGFYESDNQYPRIDTDYFGNFAVPWLETTGVARYGAYVIAPDGTILHQYDGESSSAKYAPCMLSAAFSKNTTDYTPDISEANSRGEFVYFGGRNENTITLVSSAANPANGDTLLVKVGDNTATQISYVFKTALASAYDVKIDADPQVTFYNLIKAITATGTAGTDYGTGTVAHVDVGAKVYTNISSRYSAIIQAKSPVPSGDIDATIVVQWTAGSGSAITIQTSTTYGNSIHKVRLVNSTPSSGTTRQFKTIAVSGGVIREFDDGSTVTGVTGTGFASSTSDYYMSAILFQKVYITNGQQVVVYNPKKTTIEELKSTTSGEVPKRCKLIASWRSRLVLARAADSPHNWFMSAIGDPTDWDLFPKVVNAGQAIAGTISKAGLVPDVINTLVPYNDDLLIIGGDHSIYRMTGDPMAGGQLDLITDVTGMAFGSSWDKDPQGNLYFLSPRGALYMMRPGRSGFVEISNGRFEQRLAAIDMTSNYVKVVWNDLDRMLHIFVMPYGAGGTHVAHFRYERDSDAFWQDEFGPSSGTDVQPTAAMIIDADAPGDRQLLIGGEDGRVRKWDKSSRNDKRTTSTSYPIDSQVVLGPYGAGDAEIRLTRIQAVMASDQQRANIQIFASDAPDSMGTMVWSGTLMPGRNPNIFARAKGSYFWIRIRNSWPDERWSFESLTLTATKTGRRRVRP